MILRFFVDELTQDLHQQHYCFFFGRSYFNTRGAREPSIPQNDGSCFVYRRCQETGVQQYFMWQVESFGLMSLEPSALRALTKTLDL